MDFTILLIVYEGYEGNFAMECGTTSQGLPYDFSSIMHFRHNTFSRDVRLRSTILPRNPTFLKAKLGCSTTGTDLDFLHVNLLYCGGMAVTHSRNVAPKIHKLLLLPLLLYSSLKSCFCTPFIHVNQQGCDM